MLLVFKSENFGYDIIKTRDNREDARCVRVLTGHKGVVSAVVVSPCGKIAATAGEDKKIRIWDLAQCKPIKVKLYFDSNKTFDTFYHRLNFKSKSFFYMNFDFLGIKGTYGPSDQFDMGRFKTVMQCWHGQFIKVNILFL